MANVTLVIPGLVGAPEQALFWQHANVPSFQKLLSRAALHDNKYTAYEDLLFGLFNIENNELPIAAVEALGWGLEGEHPCWLRADPAELQVGHAAAFMLGNAHLALSMEECQNFLDELNEFLLHDGMKLYAPSPTAWYLNVPGEPSFKSYSLQEVKGKNVSAYFPRGIEQDKWRSLFTELQMMLHNSTTNSMRSAKKLSLVNALWLWGRGSLPVVSDLDFQQVWTNDHLARGLVLLTEASLSDAVSLEACSLQFEENKDYLIVLSDALRYSEAECWGNWERYLKTLETHWFEPLVSLVQKKKIKQLTIHLSPGCHYEINAKLLRRWWRRRKTFTRIFYEKNN